MALSEKQLEALIGTRVSYQGRELCVIDWLPEGPSLVLAENSAAAIQGDQFGEARRRAPKVWTVPVYEPGSEQPHPLLRHLGLD